MKKKTYRPRLWPLAKRYGWFIGLWCWLQCRQQGCNWEIIKKHQTVLSQTPLPDGENLVVMNVKSRCSCCESVTSFNVQIHLRADGSGEVKLP